jgi:translation initiation factor IF-2
VRLENVIDMVTDGEILELKMVIKADTQGSVEAVKELLGKLEFKEVKIHVIHNGVGAVTETDVSLADASDAIIVGFNVRPTEKASALAEKTDVELRLYNIIYEITGDVQASVKGMMKPKIKEESLGRAEVRNTFKASKVGTIAGCMVVEGIVKRNAECRLVRDSVVIHSGILSSVRRFKDDVKEVQNGYECGLSIEKFNDIKIGDFIEVFHKVEIAPEL